MGIEGYYFTCQHCRKTIKIKNTHNMIGLPTICKDCRDKKPLNKPKYLTDPALNDRNNHNYEEIKDA